MRYLLSCLFLPLLAGPAAADVLEPQKLLDAQSWRDNRDDDWFKRNIPFFDCPDVDLVKTYYYRWELITKHLTYGSTKTGYTFTEFIDANTEHFIFEITGKGTKIDQFIAIMKPLGLVEICRTGVAALNRGPQGM